MKKPITVRATGLGHPEGPYELDDGRVIFANTYASEIGCLGPQDQRKAGSTPLSAAGRTPACWARTAPSIRPRRPMSEPGSRRSTGRPRSRRRRPTGKVEILVTEADGKTVRRAERPHLRPGRPALVHQFRRLGPGRTSRIRAASSSSRRTAGAGSSRSSTTSIRTASSPSRTGRSSGSSPTR